MNDFHKSLVKMHISHNGACHWKYQRYTAVLLIPFMIWFFLEVLFYTKNDYHSTLAWASQPWNGASLAVLVGLIFHHGSSGIQVVIEDYIPNTFYQKTLIRAVKVSSLLLAVLSWFFIIRIAIIAKG